MHAESHKVALTKLLELDFNKSHLLHKHQQTMLVLEKPNGVEFIAPVSISIVKGNEW